MTAPVRRWLARGAGEEGPRITWLNADESRFVAQSLARKHRTTSIVAVTTLSTFVVLLGLTLWSLHETERAQKDEATAKEQTRIAKEQTRIAKEKASIATSRQLAALSVSERNKRLDRSLLLAVEALRAANTFEARDTLYKALEERPGLKRFLHTSEGNVQSVAFSPDGKTLAAGYGGPDGKNPRRRVRSGGGGGGGVVLWDVAAGQRLAAAPLSVKEGDVESMAFSPDGKTLAAGYRGFPVGRGNNARLGGGGVVLWDVAARRRLAQDPLPVKEGYVGSVAFSPDGKTLAAGYLVGEGAGGGGVVLWDLAARRRLTADPLPSNEGAVGSMAFSPDGRTLAGEYQVGLGVGVMLWDVAARQRLTAQPLVKEGYVRSLAFNPAGKTLAVGYGKPDGGGGVVLLDVPKRQPLAQDPLPVKEGQVFSVAFSPEGTTLAAGFGFGGGGVVLWGTWRR